MSINTQWDNQATSQPHQILSLKEVMSLTHIARSTIYLWMEQGEFPKHFKLGARKVGWLASEIYAWIEQQALSRTTA